MCNLPEHLYLDDLLKETETSMYMKKYGHDEISSSKRQTQDLLTQKISNIDRGFLLFHEI